MYHIVIASVHILVGLKLLLKAYLIMVIGTRIAKYGMDKLVDLRPIHFCRVFPRIRCVLDEAAGAPALEELLRLKNTLSHAGGRIHKV